MSRLIVSLGLLVLFALGYTGVERVALSGVDERLGQATDHGAQLVAAQAEVEWLKLLQQTRGVVIAGAEQLAERWPEGNPSDVEAFRADITALLDRAGGRGSVALFAADRRKLLSVAAAGGAELDPTLRAIEDARVSGALAHLEFLGSKPTLIAAAPIGNAKGGARPVVAVSVPIDRRTLGQWATIAGVEAPIALLSSAGDIVLSNVEAGLSGKISKNAMRIAARDDEYAVTQRPLTDDGAVVAIIAGLALRDTGYVAGITKRLRMVYGLLAVVAIVLVLVVGAIGSGGRAVAEAAAAQPGPPPMPPGPPASWLPPPVDGASDNVLAAARMLEASASLPPALGGSMGSVAPPPREQHPFGMPLPGPGAPTPTASYANAPYASLQPAAVEPVRSWAPPAPAPAASQPPVTFGRGMSPAPPYAPGPGAPGYQPTGTYAGYTPLPMLEADPDFMQAQRLSQLGPSVPAPMSMPMPGMTGPLGGPSMAPQGGLDARPRTNDLGPRPFDEQHYRAAFDEFVSSKMRLGDPVDSISFEGFRDKLAKIEQTLIEKHGCRSVRFQVIVRDRQVSLRPQLVR
jgi:hypothetical protein